MTKKIILLLATLILGVVLGYFSHGIVKVIKPDHITVKIIDYSKCTPLRYSVITPEKTITVSGEQISKHPTQMSARHAIVLRILPEIRKAKEVQYYVAVKYSNCKDIKSDARIVNEGDLLYEFIKNGEIRHQLRN